jgi:ketosteroid isomerase-like protein
MESTMNRGFHGVLGTALAVAALAPADRQALAQEPAPRAEPAFEAAYAAFAEGYRQADAAAVAPHFAWLSSFDPGAGPVIEFDIVDRDVSSGLAYDIGYYTIRRPDAAAGSGSRGKFIVIWKQAADGTWKIHADGFSEVRESAAAAGEGK